MPRIFTLLAAALFGLYSTSAEIIISEFVAKNDTTLTDENGDTPDWIELFNSGDAAVNLENWRLTDDPELPGKWLFPNITINPQAFLVVFASGNDLRDPELPLHTSFSLSTEGEYLALIQPDGTTVEHAFDPQYPEQFTDVSYGIDQGAQRYFQTPTPGEANTSGFFDFVADTKFSHDRGFYEQPFDLVITSETADAQIRFTTNGLPPTESTGTPYTTAIRIERTTTLRAAAFKTGFEPSNVDTQTFLFLNDVIRQSTQTALQDGWPQSWGNNVRDYGMDPDVVDNPLYRDTIIADLKTIPSFSIVMDLDDLFDRNSGIYANPSQDGRDWERPASIELIDPDDDGEFQVDAGIRIRGGFSRSTQNPKHAFRLFFREEYGDSKLRYPMFGDNGADTFDNLDLRTFQNYSWSFQGDPRGIFIRDQFSRDVQLAMGHQAERGEFYHLYINGVYWGLYNTDERPEASYGETYFGGVKEDYDVVKIQTGPYTIFATDGNLDAWKEVWDFARFRGGRGYQTLLGNNDDGTPNLELPVLIDPENLIDYMLVILYGGNLDAPISAFIGNAAPNNFFTIRNRNQREGFQSFVHDAEHTLLNVTENRTGPWPAGDSFDRSNPQWVWQQLAVNAEFSLLVADRIQRHFFNGGVLSVEGATALFEKRIAQIDRAVVAESARWGDSKRGSPFTRDNAWLPEVNRIRNSYLPQRTAIVLNQLRATGLYPALEIGAPEFNQHGGIVPPDFILEINAPAGAIYFTMDGTDPRLFGGGVSPNAILYDSPVPLLQNGTIKSRVIDGTEWSALNEASFIRRQTFTDLIVSELMYHPQESGNVDVEELEFIELKNVSTEEFDLSDVHFIAGIEFRFPVGSRLAAGQSLVIVRNLDAFRRHYPNVSPQGQYSGRLNNAGDLVTLVHATGDEIFSFEYSDSPPWPAAADGQGYSLEPRNSNAIFDPTDPANWQASAEIGGSPSGEITLSISRLEGGQVQIAWDGAGVLKSSSEVQGPYSEVLDQTNPHIVQPDGPLFFIVVSP